MKTVKYFEKNAVGKDYIVGDIHGCFSLLREELTKINFNEATDRLFSVGDLVDRGTESLDSLLWISYSWFFAVRGNHEQMAIDYIDGISKDEYLYETNGGKWFLELKQKDKEVYAKAFADLPFLIELETNTGIVGIVHAECTQNDWGVTKTAATNYSPYYADVILWGRDKLRFNDNANIEGITNVVVGHTPLKHVVNLGNVVYIDTGAVYKNGFTIISADTLLRVN